MKKLTHWIKMPPHSPKSQTTHSSLSTTTKFTLAPSSYNNYVITFGKINLSTSFTIKKYTPPGPPLSEALEERKSSLLD